MENETMKTNAINDADLEKDYQKALVPKIHNIGQVTMVIGFFLMFLPGLFMYFVCGWRDIPFSAIIGFAAFYIPMVFAAQLTEHLRFYPMMGAASTYIGYLAGNATGMRLPVANSCATAFDADILSARGQVAAIVGVAVSVVANVGVLLIIIFCGDFVLSILPDIVRSAFGFITPAIFGYLLSMNMRSSGGGDVVKGALHSWPWLIVALVGRYLFKIVMASSLYMLWILLLAVGVAFVMEIIKDKKEAK